MGVTTIRFVLSQKPKSQEIALGVHCLHPIADNSWVSQIHERERHDHISRYKPFHASSSSGVSHATASATSESMAVSGTTCRKRRSASFRNGHTPKTGLFPSPPSQWPHLRNSPTHDDSKRLIWRGVQHSHRRSMSGNQSRNPDIGINDRVHRRAALTSCLASRMSRSISSGSIAGDTRLCTRSMLAVMSFCHVTGSSNQLRKNWSTTCRTRSATDLLSSAARGLRSRKCSSSR